MRSFLHHHVFGLCLSLVLLSACKKPQAHVSPVVDESVQAQLARAQSLAERFIVVDGHVDAPYRMSDALRANQPLNLAEETQDGNFDFARAKRGGLDAPFMSIYVEASFQSGEKQEAGEEKKWGAKAEADRLIDLVESMVKAAPEKFAFARTADEIVANTQKGLISLPMGIENGAAIESDLQNVKHFYDRGVRYITLTHSKDNQLSDSSYDTRKTHQGLSGFGKQVVKEMNRLGIMVDVSHLSDQATTQALEISTAPVIASHSSCRKFTPDMERNLSDELIRGIAKKGGVVMINFGNYFLTDAAQKYGSKAWMAAKEIRETHKLERHDPKLKAMIAEWQKANPPVRATLSDILDHIDHVKNLVGVDYVGFGSDFDGVGEDLPPEVPDVSAYPVILAGLLARGYTEAELEKIAGGNLLRVWRAVTAHAEMMASAANSETTNDGAGHATGAHLP